METQWQSVDDKSYTSMGPSEGSTKVVTEKLRVWGTNIWIYRDIIQVYKNLRWTVQDIKYVTINMDG